MHYVKISISTLNKLDFASRGFWKNFFLFLRILCRSVTRSKNPGGGARSTVVGIICPLIEIGLTVRPKTGPPPKPRSPRLQQLWYVSSCSCPWLVQGDICFKKAKDTIAKLNSSETAISHNMPFKKTTNSFTKVYSQSYRF